MSKPRQLPFSFNNDQDVKRVRDSFSKLSTPDLKLLGEIYELERSKRYSEKTFRKVETKDALSGFLDKISFDYFCTFTTRRPVSVFATRRIAEKVCERVDAGHSSSVFWAAEQFEVRDGFHFHALMKFPPPMQSTGPTGKITYLESSHKMELFDWYFRKYGRCQIIDNREPERQLAASHYISKYVTKRLADYDLRICKDHMR